MCVMYVCVCKSILTCVCMVCMWNCTCIAVNFIYWYTQTYIHTYIQAYKHTFVHTSLSQTTKHATVLLLLYIFVHTYTATLQRLLLLLHYFSAHKLTRLSTAQWLGCMHCCHWTFDMDSWACAAPDSYTHTNACIHTCSAEFAERQMNA